VIVLVDTDVLLDVALDRAPHADAAARLLDVLEERPGTAFVAWHTIANFYYLCVPARGRGSAREFVRELSGFVAVAPTTTDDLRYAVQLPRRDFEDALQVAAAVACRADVIATRNVRDYKRAPIKAVTPAALLTRWP